MDGTDIEIELKKRRIGYRFKMWKGRREKRRLVHEGKIVDLTTLRHWHGDYMIVLERLMFTKGIGKGTEELRLSYWDGWKFGQYATILPERELGQLLRKAKREGVLKNANWFA